MTNQLPTVQMITLAEFCEPALYAQMLGVTEDTMRNWVQSKVLPTVKVGRRRLIDRTKIKRSLDSGKTVFQRDDFSEGEY